MIKKREEKSRIKSGTIKKREKVREKEIKRSRKERKCVPL